MATITPTLTITSTDASADETLSLSVTDSLTTGQVFKGISRAIVSTTGANNIIQPATDGQTYYVYVKHTGTSDGSTAVTTTLNVELTGDVVFGKLAAGEFCFVPVGGHSLGVQLQSSSGNIVAEYAYWVKG
jgi:hypothetical protein|tara:strand:- start:59 stop:451 length:393 start_codon:yes stop_codon:yes gene_type:complete